MIAPRVPRAAALVVLALLTSCGRSSPPSEFAVGDETAAAVGAIVLRERLDALHSLSIGPLEQRRQEEPPDELAISGDWVRGPAAPGADVEVWGIPSPLLADTSMWDGERPGIQVERGGVPLEAAGRRVAFVAADRWWIDGSGTLWITSAGGRAAPTAGEVVVGGAAHAYRQSRLEFIGREPPPEEVLIDDFEIGGAEAVRGLFMPAPSRATWRLDLPAGAMALQFQPRIRVPEMAYLPDPDGVTFVVRVATGMSGGEEIHRQTVGPGETGPMTTVDLARWAGQRIKLTLETVAGENDHHDHALWLHAAVVAADPAPRRVILLFLDTLRADRLSCYGYPRPLTPALDELAARGTRFEQAYAPSPWTVPSARALFTGRPPEDYEAGPTLAEQLRREGFLTAGWTANAFLGPNFGCERGFSTWQWRFKPPADHQTDLALSWLRDHADQSAFVVVNYMDPHLPREVPDGYLDAVRETEGIYPAEPDPAGRIRAEVDRYDASVRFLDEHVGRLIREAETLPGETWIIALSDHGEELHDHGSFEHGHTLYQELVRVPLIVAGPGVAAGQAVTRPVSLQDVAPTVRGLLGLDPGAEGGAVDLGGCLQEGSECAAQADRTLALGHVAYRGDLHGLVDPHNKYVVGQGQPLLFDLASDPGERTDLSATADLSAFQGRLEQAGESRFLPTLRLQIQQPDDGADKVDLQLTFGGSLKTVLQGPSIHGARPVEHENGRFTVPLDPSEDRSFVRMNHEILILPDAPLSQVLGAVHGTVTGGTSFDLTPVSTPPDTLPPDGTALTLWEGPQGDLRLLLQVVQHPWAADGTPAGATTPALDESTLEMLRAAGYLE